MVATAEPANIGPAPTLSAASGQGAAKLIPFHPRGILERATTLEPGFVPAVPAARPRRAMWAAALLLSAAALIVWSARRPQPPSLDGATAATWASHAPEALLPDPPAAPAPPASTPRPASGASLPALRDALNQVSIPLRACARLAGGVLLVEFRTAEQRERFAGTRVIGDEPAAVLRCVDEALAAVRFAPAPAQTVTEEYLP